MINQERFILILKAVALGTSIAAVVVLILSGFPQGKIMLTNTNPQNQVVILVAISSCCTAFVGVIKK